MRLFLLAALLLAMGIHGESKKPNIVLILIDDLGLTDLQAFGGEIDTPNMDALANEGIAFTNFTLFIGSISLISTDNIFPFVIILLAT